MLTKTLRTYDPWAVTVADAPTSEPFVKWEQLKVDLLQTREEYQSEDFDEPCLRFRYGGKGVGFIGLKQLRQMVDDLAGER